MLLLITKIFMTVKLIFSLNVYKSLCKYFSYKSRIPFRVPIYVNRRRQQTKGGRVTTQTRCSWQQPISLTFVLLLYIFTSPLSLPSHSQQCRRRRLTSSSLSSLFSSSPSPLHLLSLRPRNPQLFKP